MPYSDMTPEKFKEIREMLGWSQAQMADYLGINYRTVGRWELGRTRIPHMAALLVLALGVMHKTTENE